MIAIVFPGQGAQRPGMFRDWYEHSTLARETIEQGSDLVDFDLRALCFGDDARIDRTDFTQPALFVGEIAMFRALTHEFGVRPSYFGGHSLGEYTALCAAGTLPFELAVKLVRQRGLLMHGAVPPGSGGMLAITTESANDWRDVEDAVERDGLDVASLNTARQRVLSGPIAALEAAERALSRLQESKRCELKRLNVSAPFHSRWMSPVEAAMRVELSKVAHHFVSERAAMVTSNATGQWHTPHTDAVVEALARQITSPVLWETNMSVLAGAADRVIEVGPSRPLSGFFRSIGRTVGAIVSVQTAARGLST
jgi:malonyl CoA-acyl carrier protein transacylase